MIPSSPCQHSANFCYKGVGNKNILVFGGAVQSLFTISQLYCHSMNTAIDNT